MEKARFTGAPGFFMRVFLSPFAGLYSLIMSVRNRLYDLKLLRSYGFDTPIISIGNLTAGGTGKTPLTAFLVQACLDRGLRVAIVSRGYGSEIKTGWARVPSEIGKSDAKKYGDEPCWFATHFPQVPVYVGPDRSEVVRALLMPPTEQDSGASVGEATAVTGQQSSGKNKIDLIFADDAFQHRRLRRAMDIVVIDATQPRWHYRSLPLGRVREGFQSLKRASLVFVTKCNLGDPAQLVWLKEQLDQAPTRPVVCTDAKITRFLDRERKVAFTFTSTDRLLLVSGIGRPETFESAMKQAVPSEIAGHLIFQDHQKYDDEATRKIELEATRLKVDAIVITEKDAVKLMGWNSSVPVAVATLETKVAELPNAIEADSSRRLKDFYEALDRLLR